MNRPPFTIITPNYNAGDKLLATAQSVIDQDVRLEYLIIDGASNDQSLADAYRLAGHHPDRMRVVSDRDEGIYDAMNRGISIASGRYLYFLGCGDTLFPGVLSAVAAELPADERTLVYGDTLWDGQRYAGRFTPRALRLRNLPHQAAFYGRDIFPIVGNYELKYRLLADWALNLAVFGNRRIRRKYVDVVVARYEGGGASDVQADPAFAADRARLEKRLGRWARLNAGAYDLGSKVKHLLARRRP